MNPATVFLSEYAGDMRPYDYEEAALAEVGATLRASRCSSGDELVAAAQGSRVLWIEWGPKVTAEVLQALPSCELVVRWGVGYDQIDADAATSLGVAVANTPSYCTDTVAEHALALVLAVTRQVSEHDRAIHLGSWPVSGWECATIGGRTFGVVGLGRIGRRVAALARAFGCEVLGHDVVALAEPPEGVHLVDLRELLRRSDVVSLHVPLTARTEHLIDKERIGWMKEGAVLVNTSRGRVVEESALVEAVSNGRLFGAGLDVFETEPLPAESELRRLEHVVMTPHEAASSPASKARIRAEICSVTTSWLNTGWAPSVVNPRVREGGRWAGPSC